MMNHFEGKDSNVSVLYLMEHFADDLNNSTPTPIYQEEFVDVPLFDAIENV
ncbi:MAG: hypothetical protein ACI92E_001322 [Oceanicoccus sp.]|jgi:hypothetical protein